MRSSKLLLISLSIILIIFSYGCKDSPKERVTEETETVVEEVSEGIPTRVEPQSKSEGDSKEIGETDNEFTPLVMSVLSTPIPVKGSDGRFHLVYELKVTNTTSLTWEIQSVEVLDNYDTEKVLASFSGEEVTDKMELIENRNLTNILEMGQTGLIFVQFSVETKEDIPESLVHRLRITVPGGIPEGFANFVGLAPGEEQLVETGAITEVGSADAMVIGSPVEGSGWIAADGCCTAVRHIRAFLPIDGKLFISQRFAIDWEMLNGDNRIFVGDPLDVNSYFCYGQKALAVADAKVITVVDGLKDQIPGALPSDITLKEADGNHVVLDLGNSHIALYAHLMPNSIIVSEGDSVKRGQVLGLVGNSGNTSEPHLHFHIMSSPSAFGSNGLPYVIDEFNLLGRAPSTEAFDKAALEGTPLEILPVNNPGIHRDELPLDLRIVEFPSASNRQM